MYWINLAQGKDNWSTIVNKVKELCLPYNAARFLLIERAICFSWTLLQGVR
jgi:hypothetical protein